MSVAAFAFRIGRRLGKHPKAGRLFCLTERLLPLNRIARRNDLVAFHHPRPIETPHVLIVPTKPVASLTGSSLSDEQLSSLIWRMAQLGRAIASRLPASHQWQLVINGGIRQDIGQLHGHLLHADASPVSGHSLADPSTAPNTWHQVHTELNAAAAVPGNGFSLVIHWQSDEPPTAKVTQSGRA